MPFTNFPNGITSFGIPIYGGSGLFGPTCGKIRYVVESRTGNWGLKLTNQGIPSKDIFTTVQTAHDACTEQNNDVVIVAPDGWKSTTAIITWSKDYTHLVGMGVPRDRAVILLTTTANESVMTLSGRHCEFHNINWQSWVSDSAGKCAVKETGSNNFFSNCRIVGDYRSQQAGSSTCCSLWIDSSTSGAGIEDYFYNCRIGDANTYIRTAGAVMLIGTTGGTAAPPKDMLFDKCVFESWSVTAGCTAVTISDNSCLDRLNIFRDCAFSNYYTGNSFTGLTEVFDDNCSTDHTILLQNCTQVGWTNWDSGGVRIRHSMSTVAAGGGIAVQAT